MSSLLRSSKFTRCFAGAARSLILNTPKEFKFKDFTKLAGCTNTQLIFRDYATIKSSENLEPLLQRLDNDARRIGRITRRDIDGILEQIRQKYSITSSQSLLIIRCCGDLVPEELPEERTQLVQKIWSILQERGVRLDISHYNALLRVYIENEHQFSPAEFLEELEKKGIQPNRVTYQRLMWSYCQTGNVEGATQVLERMRELGLPVSEPVLNALVMGHAFHGDTAGAKSVLQTMSAAGLQPTSRTYTLLARGLAKEGDIEGIAEVIKKCNESDIILMDRELMEIVETLAVSGHSQSVEKILNEMHHGPGYNQDCINLILRLLNQNQDDVALQVFDSLVPSIGPSGDSSAYQGAFFVKHLVKVASNERTMNLCGKLKDSNKVPRAFQIAAEEAFSTHKLDLALILFKQLQNDGFAVRQHYFWPILCSHGNKSNTKGVLDTLKRMIEEFQMSPGLETLRDYVLPYLNIENPDQAVNDLINYNVKPYMAAKCVIFGLMNKGDLQGAVKLASGFPITGHVELFCRPMAMALKKTPDVDSYIRLVHLLCDVEGRIRPAAQEEETNEVNFASSVKERIGLFLYNVVQINRDSPTLIENVLRGILKQGLSISGSWANKIQDLLGSELSSQTSDLLSKLTDNELDPVQLKVSPRTWVRSPNAIEHLLSTGNENNEALLKRQLITAYMRSGENEKLKALIEKLQSENYIITGGTYAQLINYFSQANDYETALKYKEELFKKEPDFTLDLVKSLRVAYCLIQLQKYEEAVDFLTNVSLSDHQQDESFTANSVAWQSLNYLAEKGEIEMVEKLTNIILEKKLALPSNIILGPSIKVHIVRDNLEKALDVFETFCNKYRYTPWKSELSRRFIQKEDAGSLQRLTDLSTTVHGEINSLYDLVFAFVECGRLRQARRILETPGLRTRPHRLSSACEKYQQDGKTEHLEGLLEATKELSHINRSDMYYHLLVSYCKDDNPDKALGLWTLLQEEDELPTDKFLIHLANFLNSKNLNVPFVVPQETKVHYENTKVDEKKKISETEETLSFKLKSLVDSGDLTAATDLIKNKLKNNNLRFRDKNSVLFALLDKQMVNEAFQLLFYMLKMGKAPGNEGISKVIGALTELEKIEQLGQLLSESQRRGVKYNYKVCLAYFEQGKAEEYITNLEKRMQEAKTQEDWQSLGHSYPRSLCFKHISDNKPLKEKLLSMADEFASHKVMDPINVLWSINLLNGQKEEANQLWEKHLVHSESPLKFRNILQNANENSNTELVEEILKLLKQKVGITPGAYGNMASRLLDMVVSKGEIEKVENIIKEGLAFGLTMKHFNEKSITRVKKACEEGGIKLDLIK